MVKTHWDLGQPDWVFRHVDKPVWRVGTKETRISQRHWKKLGLVCFEYIASCHGTQPSCRKWFPLKSFKPKFSALGVALEALETRDEGWLQLTPLKKRLFAFCAHQNLNDSGGATKCPLWCEKKKFRQCVLRAWPAAIQCTTRGYHFLKIDSAGERVQTKETFGSTILNSHDVHPAAEYTICHELRENLFQVNSEIINWETINWWRLPFQILRVPTSICTPTASGVFFSRALLLARSDSTSHSAMSSMGLSVHGRTSAPPPTPKLPPPSKYDFWAAQAI